MVANPADKADSKEDEVVLCGLRWHCNYCVVNGDFNAIQCFWKYLKYFTYQMLNSRDQKGKLKYLKYLQIWKYYILEPHLTNDTWKWQPKTS